jgi:NAD(P)-dependent dehydrogenase (short-subunit alcohol dehydrogenase family)
MTEARSVVITGASRGLGFASAVHLHQQGWHVVAAMRTPDAGLERIRAATGAEVGDPRLTGVRLDLDDASSIAAAAQEIQSAVGAPDAVVHNAGIVSVGCVEELPDDVFESIFATNVFGAVRLTKALLPSMRAAGRGRFVVISSEGGIHGMPAISAYSASKGALERWAEALTLEVNPFGIGVTVLVVGTFKTDVLDAAHTMSYGNPEGPYKHLHAGQAAMEDKVIRFAKPPEAFGPILARALESDASFDRIAVGPDARAMRVMRWLLPARAFQKVVGKAIGIPRPGALQHDPLRLAPVHEPDLGAGDLAAGDLASGDVAGGT